MNLLFKHITNIPIKEKLVGIFIVDDNVYYVATTYKENNNIDNTEYRLYSVSNYSITKYMGNAKMISEFDMIIHKNLPHIIEQSAYTEDSIRIVKYKTFRKETTRTPKEMQIIERDAHNRHKKLF